MMIAVIVDNRLYNHNNIMDYNRLKHKNRPSTISEGSRDLGPGPNGSVILYLIYINVVLLQKNQLEVSYSLFI